VDLVGREERAVHALSAVMLMGKHAATTDDYDGGDLDCRWRRRQLRSVGGI